MESYRVRRILWNLVYFDTARTRVLLIPRPPAAQFVRAVKNVGVEPKGLAERRRRVWTGLRRRTKQESQMQTGCTWRAVVRVE